VIIVKVIILCCLAGLVVFFVVDDFKYKRATRQAEENYLIDQARRHD
jgi:hypothetical protein